MGYSSLQGNKLLGCKLLGSSWGHLKMWGVAGDGKTSWTDVALSSCQLAGLVVFLAGTLPPFPSSVSFEVSAVVQFQSINSQISEVTTVRDVEWLEKNPNKTNPNNFFFLFKCFHTTPSLNNFVLSFSQQVICISKRLLWKVKFWVTEVSVPLGHYITSKCEIENSYQNKSDNAFYLLSAW